MADAGATLGTRAVVPPTRLHRLPAPLIRLLAFALDYASYHRLLMTCRSTRDALEADPNRDVRRPWIVFDDPCGVRSSVPNEAVERWLSRWPGKTFADAVAAFGIKKALNRRTSELLFFGDIQVVPYRYRHVARVWYQDTMHFGFWNLHVDVEAYAKTMFADDEIDAERVELTKRIMRVHFAACVNYANHIGNRCDSL